MNGKTGLLLVNLGTPDDPSVKSLTRYLAQFLTDPHIIDVWAPLRYLIVYGFILPTRPAKSAEAYKSIWGPRGSPLRYHTEDFAEKLQTTLGSDFVTKLAMRYGKPSIKKVLTELKELNLSRIIVFPLFPHYAFSSTLSAIDEVKKCAEELGIEKSLQFIESFYDDPGYLEAVALRSKPSLESFKPDHVLFSFHGVPERQILKTDIEKTHCFVKDLQHGIQGRSYDEHKVSNQIPSCCASECPSISRCYRAQSYRSAHEIAKRLELSLKDFSIAFQSRLGRTAWLAPYTDYVVKRLARSKIKRLAVICPSFVADCLETLEEIEMRAREDFIEAGGEDLCLVPALNADDRWVEASAKIVHSRL